ncbi:DUF485 domain-containing protein [Sporosarcina sp. A2]|uniref:DUF485 domain-containing protein n=1 Tax=Sporosarcina sp. A2 TaxID=3393449 RepID=UPI003D7A6FAC
MIVIAIQQVQKIREGDGKVTVEIKQSEVQPKRELPRTADGKLDYERIIETPEFKRLIKKKNRFITPYVIAFFTIYLLLPILTGYTSILETRAVGWMTWTWIYAFGLFLMVWVFTQIYVKKARDFDKDIDQIIQTHIKD